MDPFHLIWIVPAAMFSGAMVMGIIAGGKVLRLQQDLQWEREKNRSCDACGQPFRF